MTMKKQPPVPLAVSDTGNLCGGCLCCWEGGGAADGWGQPHSRNAQPVEHCPQPAAYSNHLDCVFKRWVRRTLSSMRIQLRLGSHSVRASPASTDEADGSFQLASSRCSILARMNTYRHIVGCLCNAQQIYASHLINDCSFLGSYNCCNPPESNQIIAL